VTFPVAGARGTHDLYLLFPESAVNVNTVRFTKPN
jgi:hypothetical protein